MVSTVSLVILVTMVTCVRGILPDGVIDPRQLWHNWHHSQGQGSNFCERAWIGTQCVLLLTCFPTNEPDECPCLCLQGSQAMLQLLVPPNEVHCPHCEVQEALASPQQNNSLTLLVVLLVLQYLFPAPLLMPPGRGLAVQTVLASILGVIAVTGDSVSGNVRLLLLSCRCMLPQVVSCEPHSWRLQPHTAPSPTLLERNGSRLH
jgi:hypothetical protein